MLTEECGLNPHLEALGIEVTDTDLGEWIVQLRHEHPSHIVMPAIHIRKEEVGQLFHEKLGTAAGATDPKYLAEAARHELRNRFLNAQTGITGVNFAVAETGGFVVCTNEGNADLGVSLPKVHIACMGIEKLIPRAADLGVFLRLLARSRHRPTDHHLHVALPRPDAGRRAAHRAPRQRPHQSARAAPTSAARSTASAAAPASTPAPSTAAAADTATASPSPARSARSSTPPTIRQAHKSLPFACSLCGSCTDVCP